MELTKEKGNPATNKIPPGKNNPCNPDLTTGEKPCQVSGNGCLKVTWFPNVNAKTKKEEILTWPALVERLNQIKPVKNKKQSPLIKLASFGDNKTEAGSLRSDYNLLESYGLELDLDSGALSQEQAKALLERYKIRAAILRTYSWTPETPKLRILVPLSKPINKEQRKDLVGILDQMLGGNVGPESYTNSQTYFTARKAGTEDRVDVTLDDPEEGFPLDVWVEQNPGHHFCSELLPGGIGIPGEAPEAKDDPKEGQGETFKSPLEMISDLARAVEALQAIPPDVGYEEWLKVTMALKSSGGGPLAYSAWVDWTRRGSNYKPGDESKWSKVKEDGRVRLGTLFKIAKDHGWGKQGGFQLHHISSIGLKPPEWLWKKHIETDSLAVLWGDSDTYKSFFSIDLAMCVATGKPLNDHPVEQGPVVYVCGEGQGGIRRRFEAWAIRHQVKLDKQPVYITTVPVEMIREGVPAEIIKGIEGITNGSPIKLIVVDTLARNMGEGDENSTKDMNAFVNAATIIQKHFRATCLVVHHTGQGNKDRMRGGYTFKAGVDIEYQMRRRDDSTVDLISRKMKDGPKPPPTSFKARVVNLGIFDEDSYPITSLVLDPAEYTNIEAKGVTREQDVYAVVERLILGEGVKPPFKGVPLAIRGQTRIREEALKMESFKGVEEGKSTISRLLNEMAASNKLGKRESWWWVIDLQEDF